MNRDAREKTKQSARMDNAAHLAVQQYLPPFDPQCGTPCMQYKAVPPFDPTLLTTVKYDVVQGQERKAGGERYREDCVQRQRRHEGLRRLLRRPAVPRGNALRRADCPGRAYGAGTV